MNNEKRFVCGVVHDDYKIENNEGTYYHIFLADRSKDGDGRMTKYKFTSNEQDINQLRSLIGKEALVTWGFKMSNGGEMKAVDKISPIQ